MPVFINEVIAEIPQPVVPNADSKPVEERMPVSEPEYQLMQTLSLIEERQQRLQFD